MNSSRFHIYKAVSVFVFLWYITAASQGIPKILFVYMRLHENVLSVEKVKVVNGTLKAGRSQEQGGFYYEISGPDGKPMVTDVVRKPEKIPYDYFDADNRLKGGFAPEPEEIFIVRVPFKIGMGGISFYTVKTVSESHLGKTRATRLVKDSLIAQFPLNLKDW